jgi:C-terminal processing protease CtpA/Prc
VFSGPPRWRARREKCSYRNRSSATVWQAWWLQAKSLAIALALAGAACSAEWSGSVGAILGRSDRDGRLFVREAPAEMSAARAGIRSGDEVTTIGGRAVAGMTPEEVHGALAGPVGSKVKLTVVRDGQDLAVEVERGPLRGQ